MTDEHETTPAVEVAAGALPPRPAPPERLEREPEPEPKTPLQRLIRLIAA